MKYKAIIFDLDGTAIPNDPEGRPSKKLQKVVDIAKKDFIITVATGRAITMCRPIIKELGIESPCLISGGTQIIEPKSEKTIWEKPLDPNQVKEIIETCKPYPYSLLFDEELLSSPSAVHASKKYFKGTQRVAFLMTAPKEMGIIIMEKIRMINQVKVSEVPSWTKDCVDLHITHAEATKEHGLKVLFEILGVKNEEVVGIGDGNNDLPLFASVGFKVAMGNATPEMKAASDFIAPPVEQDGVASTIEKLLNNELHN